jgi:hypothetical protein
MKLALYLEFGEGGCPDTSNKIIVVGVVQQKLGLHL